MLGYLSADIICSERRKENCGLRLELIMSRDKYLSIVLKPNGGYCVYYPSNIFRNAHLGNITGYSAVLAGNIQSRDAFRPIACERKYLMDFKDRYVHF